MLLWLATACASGGRPPSPPEPVSTVGETVERIVAASAGRVHTCVEMALVGGDEPAGVVSVGFTVASGRVTEAHLVGNSTGSEQLGTCVVGAARTWRFPEGMTASVTACPFALGYDPPRGGVTGPTSPRAKVVPPHGGAIQVEP